VRTTSGSWLRSYLGVPIRSRGQVIGFLNIESSEPGSFQMEVAETLRAFADQAGQAIDNARLFEDAHRRLAQLQGLRTIDAAISGSVDLRLSLRVLLEQVIRQLGVDAADVLVLDARSQRLRYTAGQGFRGAGSPDADLSLGEGPAGLAALERRTVRVPDLAMLSGEFPRKSQLVAEGFASLFAVPLLAKGQVRGVLEVFHRSRLAGDSEWIAFLETLAGEAAIAVDNAALFEDLQRSNLELMVAFDATLESWSRALDLRNHEPEGNSLRVADLAVRAAAHMGVPEDTLPHIRRGALLHDIGMLALPESVLLKPGPLSESEWEAVRAHPQRALDLLAHVEFLRPALEIPYGHHERFDGSGYPRRLAGEAIPAGARAFAVVDVWDALSSDRPYRPAWSDARVSAHLRENAGRLFDSRAVAAFFEALAES
jgi:GAF domain-containing protein